jgi:hypothetical protein
MKFYIFVPNKKGHYDDYALFLSKLLWEHEVIVYRKKIDKLFAVLDYRSNVILLDIDQYDLLWSLFRSFYSFNTYAVSVSIETLISSRSTGLWSIKNNISLIKKSIKTFMIKYLVAYNRLKLISIHKETPYELNITQLVSFCTYDFQYYDLQYLQPSFSEPLEVKNKLAKEISKPYILIVNNTSAEKKNLEELKNWIVKSEKFNFIIVGNNSFIENKIYENVILINRYISNEELLYLMNHSNFIYCYYSNNRPSGFMGRAMQLNKNVIVKKNSYLGNISYGRSIKVDSLREMEDLNFQVITNGNLKAYSENLFDESSILKAYLTNGSTNHS